jgi:hypothetical protein
MLAAVIVGVACAWVSSSHYVGANPHLNGGDFGYAWRAARWLVEGENPYTRMDPSAAYGAGGPFLYPLTAALAVLPLAALSVNTAATIFVGLGAALLAYALTARSWIRLLALASPPFLFSVQTANWPPLIAAAALLPPLRWLAAAKPNTGLVSFAYAPTRAATISILLFLGISLLVLPGWPLAWLDHLARQPVSHISAVMWPAGALGLLGLLRWRTPEGRALFALTIVPTASLPYDWVSILLCARSDRETIALTVALWAGWLAVVLTAPNRIDVAWTRGHLLLALGWILPATFVVLRHPNCGDLPVSLERASRWLPRGLRGTPATLPASN